MPTEYWLYVVNTLAALFALLAALFWFKSAKASRLEQKDEHGESRERTWNRRAAYMAGYSAIFQAAPLIAKGFAWV